MALPEKQKDQTVTWREYSGSRPDIMRQIHSDTLPHQWGEPNIVANYIMGHVPAGIDWHGVIRVTGYRTPPNDAGTGTAYVSVHWEPKHAARTKGGS